MKKILVPNRGEIAIRIFRACTELGIRTVAIYSYEDRFSLHRYKADEAYLIGKKGAPVGSYLDIPAIIEIAKKAGVDGVHPGYGFLSERADFQEALEKEGITFIGPSRDTLDTAGNKVNTRELAKKAGVPIVPGSTALSGLEEAKKFANDCSYPVILKASYGGGGRGMRVVNAEPDLEAAFEAAQSEAKAAFGKSEIFLEKFVEKPKHVEVQLLGDGNGEVLHLFERDCSIQRRHQKVIEYAPAIGLDENTRNELHQHALSLGKALNLKAAATVEFLVGADNKIYFIEINPRIQVEHTVTEEVTGIDLVQSQIQIASGKSLKELDLSQDSLSCNGVAVQCRITTEDPENNFTPDYGTLLAYRSASGFGIRLDAGSAFAGGKVLPFYDSMLVKVTARGRNMEDTVRRLRRALSEFRIRGVKTNIAFLDNVLSHEKFLSGASRTSFLEEEPEVFNITPRKDRANKLLKFLGNVKVNGHKGMPGISRPEKIRKPSLEELFQENTGPKPDGWKNTFEALGKEEFLKKVREENSLLITDTTFRDAHQSLLATRMRSADILPVADLLSRQAPQLFSLEMWGGATFDVMLRFLREDPWERLARLREAVPNILFQMLFRGTNAVGYKSYPDNVIEEFVKEANSAGIDIFRIFDSLNNVDRMNKAIDVVSSSGAIAEVCLCYTGDVVSEEKAKNSGDAAKYTLEYYLNLAKELESAGADIIAIKDMAGLLRPESARVLVSALRKETKLPIHFHTHDTAGVQTASYLEASDAGVDIVDCAFSAMSGVTSQPSLEGIVAALENTTRDTGLNHKKLTSFSSYWECVRTYYAPFESDLRSATSEVYENEIPGGQYSNFRPQAESLGLGDRWSELKKAYADVNKLLGGIIKVTPSSKMVGDFALFLVSNNLTIEDVKERASELDFPASVIEFFQGEIGTPYGGFPEKLRKDILRDKEAFTESTSTRLAPADFEDAKKTVGELIGRKANQQDALSYLLYPHVYKEYAKDLVSYGKVLQVPTTAFLYGLEEGEEIYVDLEKGKRLYIKFLALSEADQEGKRTAFYELNGQPRSIVVQDTSVAPEKSGNTKAETGNEKHVGVSLSGVLVDIEVKAGQAVAKDEALFTIEAMKMQTVVRAPIEGKVKNVLLSIGSNVDVGDLVIELE